MKIKSLEIVNFRAIGRVQIENCGDLVVIAGPNGSGKSCVLDSLRLLKSTYAGYQQNEWQHWLGEFQINFNQHSEEILKLFRDKSAPLSISAEIEIDEAESEYIESNALDLLKAQIWRQIAPELAGWRRFGAAPFSAQARLHQAQVDDMASQALSELTGELQSESIRAHIEINTRGEIRIAQSRLLESLFSLYETDTPIGVLEFHSADRFYNRETVGAVTLDVTSAREQRRNHALYNAQGKFGNVKSELASAEVRKILAKQAGAPDGYSEGDIVDSMKELFSLFFPGKTFLGPKAMPNGTLDFPVELENGSVHDIDELSAGEKEVVYGYLRLRNSAAKNSIVLIDEPELHLNPKLVRGLVRFYRDHLVSPLNNQLWLISHSDALLRDAVAVEGCDVYHLTPQRPEAVSSNQSVRVDSSQQLESIIVDLVGDLATYRPGAKIVLIEGGGESRFDQRMIADLFPEFDESVNLISSGSKRKVQHLHDVLDEIGDSAIGAQFFSICDKDNDFEGVDAPRRYEWDRYHIENYLLEAPFVLAALQELSRSDNSLKTEHDVEAALIDAARLTMPKLVRDRMVGFVGRRMLDSIDVGGDPNCADQATEIHATAEGSAKRINDALATDLSAEKLASLHSDLMREHESALEDGEWRSLFRGRDVLKRFAGSHAGGVDYITLRDLVLARMRSAKFRPAGMERVVSEIGGVQLSPGTSSSD